MEKDQVAVSDVNMRLDVSAPHGPRSSSTISRWEIAKAPWHSKIGVGTEAYSANLQLTE